MFSDHQRAWESISRPSEPLATLLYNYEAHLPLPGLFTVGPLAAALQAVSTRLVQPSVVDIWIAVHVFRRQTLADSPSFLEAFHLTVGSETGSTRNGRAPTSTQLQHWQGYKP